MEKLKTTFNCKILLTVHYTNWGISLYGDFRKLNSLLSKVNKGQVVSHQEKRVIDTFHSDKAIFQQTDHILFVAQHAAKTYAQLSSFREENFTIVNNGLKDVYKKLTTAQKRIIRNRYAIKKQDIMIFFAGWLAEIKGVYCLIEAFKKVFRSKPDVRLFIAGEGDFPKLLSKSRFIGSQITFLGFLDKSEIYNFYSIADIGIVCSIYEEFGLVALEMMMHQLPIIVSNTGGLAEIVDDTVNGLKVPVVYRKGKRTVDINQLTQKISFLIDHPDERKRIGVNARKKFLSNYEQSVFCANMNIVYNTL